MKTMVLAQSPWKTARRCLRKCIKEPPNEPATPLRGRNPRRVKSLSQREPRPHAHGSSVHGSQDLEAPKCPWTDGCREDVVHIMDGMYVSLSNGNDSAMR